MIRRVSRTNPYRQWLVWQKAQALADEIHTVTKQMRRAGRSIPMHIASGSRHSVKRQKRRCYRQAQVSLAALDACLDMSRSPLRALGPGRVKRLAVLQRDVDRLLKVLVHFVP